MNRRYRKTVIAGNWKMNMTPSETAKLIGELKPLIANEACDAGRVSVNGKPARASYDVKVGDILEISFGARLFKAEVTSVAETVRKDDAAGLYRVME